MADTLTEADELYQNAGEKGRKHAEPEDPPRRRANTVKGHGTWENDRPPVAGVVGRESGDIRLQVCHNSDRETLVAEIEPAERRLAANTILDSREFSFCLFPLNQPILPSEPSDTFR